MMKEFGLVTGSDIMERTLTIAYMLGGIQMVKNVDIFDAMIEVDQYLIYMNQPPMTPAEKNELRRLAEQMDVFVMQMGFNRREGRKLARKNVKRRKEGQ